MSPGRFTSNRSSLNTRRYATLEESEAVVPVFTTPTDMYLRSELNSQTKYAPSPNQRPMYSPTSQANAQLPKQYSTPKAFDPLANNMSPPASYPSSPSQYGKAREQSTSTQATADNTPSPKPFANSNTTANSNGTSSTFSTTSGSTKTDMLLAQLIEMGFSLESSKSALKATGGSSLQDALEMLIQNTFTETHRPTETNANDESSDEEEDQRQEEIWKRQQEERRKEYLDQLKRNKPIPPTPPTPPHPPMHNNTQPRTSFFSSPKPSTQNAPPKTDPISLYAEKERKQGNFFFNKQQYKEAESAYSLAIGSLPSGHGDLVLLSNNRAAARLKQAKYHDCLSDCSVAIDLARKHMKAGAPPTPMISDASTTMNAQLVKAIHRKACALEGLRLFEAAIQMYEEYVRMEGARSGEVNQGIIRCQQALSEQKNKQNQSFNEPSWKAADENASAFPDIDFNMFAPKTTQLTQAELDEINNSKAVLEMREREKKREAEEAEKAEKQDKVNSQISAWKLGKEKNLRALLSTLDSVLWEGVQWKSIAITELFEPRKCKVVYMKAIAKVHPDKLSSNATIEQRLLANGIFTTLNQAWDTFRSENNL